MPRAPQRFPCTALLLLACLLGAGGAARAGDAAPGYDPVLAQMGAEAYPRYCASCHGLDAKGHGPAAGALKTPPADLTRIAARRDGSFPAAEMARLIDGRFGPEAHGSREMPIWGERLGAEIPESDVAEEVVRGRIVVLVEYLKSIQEPREPR